MDSDLRTSRDNRKTKGLINSQVVVERARVGTVTPYLQSIGLDSIGSIHY
jgi:hypothetical protein